MLNLRDMRCNCGIPVARRTSWTHENPGRKFIACKIFNAETGHRGCQTFEWIDEEIVDWQRDVTNVLIAEKHRLATDNSLLKSKVAILEHEKKRLVEEVENLKHRSMGKKDCGQHSRVIIQKEKNGVCFVLVCVIASVVFSSVFMKKFG